MAAFFFDFNGVLVDDEMVHFAAMRDVVAPLGVALTEEQYKERYFAFDDRRAFTEILRDHGHAADESTIARCVAEKLPRYLAAVEHDLVMFPGGFSLLAAAHARGPVAIVSGALRVEIDFALAKAGVASAVDLIVAADDVEACKPDPEGYLAALAALSLDPREAVVIEDSVGGVRAARAAGCAVVAVGHSYDEAALRGAGANDYVARIGELSVERLEALTRGRR
jgi:beta-phosphoglucomutase